VNKKKENEWGMVNYGKQGGRVSTAEGGENWNEKMTGGGLKNCLFRDIKNICRPSTANKTENGGNE